MKLRQLIATCLMSAGIIASVCAHGDLHDRISQITAEIQAAPSAGLFLRRGRLHLEHRQAMRALLDVQRSERLDPGNREAPPLRAEALMFLGKHKAALKTLNRFLKQNPAASRGLVLRARTLTRLGDFTAAIADYQKALELTPKADPDLVLEVASALEKQNRADEALAVLDQAINRLGPLPSLGLPAVELEAARKNWNGALRRIDTLQAAAPRPGPWMARRASMLARAGQIEASCAAWKSLLTHLAGQAPAERQSHATVMLAREARQALVSLTGKAPSDEITAENTPAPEAGGADPAPPSPELAPAPDDPPADALTRGPYLQLATPASMVIRWRGSQPVIGRVNIWMADGTTIQSFDEPAATTEHCVKLTGLVPATTYFYNVGSPGSVLAGGDAEHTFTTPPVAGTAKKTRIWVLGDAGTDNISQRNVRDAFYTFTGSRTPDLCLLLGDNAYGSGLDTEYQAAVFETYPAMLKKTPFWSCLGNHDTGQLTDFAATFPYFDIFTFPTAGEAGGVASGTEHYFSFDYGNIHFISLDSMTADRAPGGAMATWLAADLASTTATWIIAFFHHPPYTKGSHDSDIETELIEMRANILPILETGGVDLVLNGHSHCYERSFLLDGHYGLSTTLAPAMKKNAGDGKPDGDGAYLKPLTGPRDRFGAVYNVTGSAGQISGGTLNHPAMRFSVLELGSVILDVRGPRLDSTFLRDDGTIRDTYTILKQGEADSDADGMPDTYETANHLDRHNPVDAALDLDGDGASNLTEHAFGRPASLADVYAFTTVLDAASATVTFQTVIGRTYRVLWSQTLLDSDWHPGSPPIPGTGAAASWIDDGTITPGPPGPGTPRRFYRIEAITDP